MTALPINLPKLLLYPGARRALPEELQCLGISRPWLVTDQGIVAAGIADMVIEALGTVHHICDDAVAENPTIASVDAAAARFVASGCNGIVALGGGSVLDTAKGVAIVAEMGGSVRDYLGRQAALTRPLTPLVAIPTTAGSGSDASPATGIHPSHDARAVGTRSPFLVPRTTIADAELTLNLPSRLTAATGLDALSHCIEGFLAKTHSPLLDALALSGIGRIARSLERAVRDGKDIEAREQMLCAAFEGGAAIAKGLGPAHAMANSLGDRGLHHGTLVAAAMPLVIQRAQELHPERMALIAGTIGVSADETLPWLKGLMDRLDIEQRIAAAPFANTSRDEIAQDCALSPFNLATPLPPTYAEYRAWIDIILG